MSQGYEANHSGRFLEDLLRRELVARGFLFRKYTVDADNLDMFNTRVLVWNVPYVNVFGGNSRSEFVIHDRNRKIRVECKWQGSTGSCDEKLVYVLKTMVECAPEKEILILYGGTGWRTRTIEWLKREAKRTTTKTVHVINVNEFPSWVKRELMSAGVAA